MVFQTKESHLPVKGVTADIEWGCQMNIACSLKCEFRMNHKECFMCITSTEWLEFLFAKPGNHTWAG